MNIRQFNQITPKIAKSAYVDPFAIIIGEVEIGEDSSIWPFACVRGDMHTITIGKRSSIQDGSVCHITHKGKYNKNGYPLIIGNNVTVGHKVMLHGCTILDNCIIGIDSTVLDGATIESNVILGAKSLVPPNKTLESGFLYLGSPAKRIRKLTNEELEFIEYSAANYVNLKNTYLKQGQS